MPTVSSLINVEIKDFPHLIYSSKTIKKLLTYLKTTHATYNEFMFLGYISKTGKDYLLYDVTLVPQTKCSGAYCETDDNRYPEWLAKNIPVDQRASIRLHGHSHVNMATMPSGTDDKQIKELCANVDNYFIQLIINHRLENTVNIWDKEANLIYHNCEQEILMEDGTLISFSSSKTIQLKQPKIKNGTYSIEDNKLKINNNTYFDLINNSYSISDSQIKIIKGTTNSIELANDKDPELFESQKTMNEMVATQYYTPPYYKQYGNTVANKAVYNYPLDTESVVEPYEYEYDYDPDYLTVTDLLTKTNETFTLKYVPQEIIDGILNNRLKLINLHFNSKDYAYNHIKDSKHKKEDIIKLQDKKTRKYKYISIDDYLATITNPLYKDYVYIGCYCWLVNDFVEGWEDEIYGLI